MKVDAVVVGLAFCIAGIAYWAHRQDDARVQAIRAENDSLARSINDSTEAFYRHRQADQLRERALEGEIIRLRASYTRAQGQTDTLLDTLTVLDSLGLVHLRAQLGNERAEARALIAGLDSTVQWQAGRIRYWRDTVLGARDEQLAISQRLLREALAAKRPSRVGVFLGPACGPNGCGVGVGVGVRIF